MAKLDIELTRQEIFAALVACSNFTPSKGTKWKQAAQARVAMKLKSALAKANMLDGVKFTK